MSQGLTIQNESLAPLHRIIDVEVLHTQNIFIDVKLTKIPVVIQKVSILEFLLLECNYLPDHRTQRLNGRLAGQHVSDCIRNTRPLLHYIILIRIKLLELIETFLVPETLALAKSSPKTRSG